MRRLKISASVLLVLLAAGVFSSHQAGSFFPWLPAAAFVGLSIVAASILFTDCIPRRVACGVVAALIIFSTLYRGYIFVAPTSLVGIDPNLYATWIRAVVLEGSISAVQNPFYSRVPGSIVLPAIYALVSDVSSASALIVYPIVAGILAPLLGYAFYRRLAPALSHSNALLTATVVTIAATSVRYSYVPIAQLPSGLLVAVLVLGLLAHRQSQTVTQRHTTVELVALAGLIITHKLGLFLVVSALGFSGLFVAARRFARSVIDRFAIPESSVTLVFGVGIIVVWGIVVSLFSPLLFAGIGVCLGGLLLYSVVGGETERPPRRSMRVVRGLLPIAAVALVIQWVFLSLFIRSFLINTIGALLTFPQSSSAIPDYQAAVRASSGILAVNGSWANVLLPLLLVALVIVAMTVHGSEREGVEIGVGFLAVLLALAPTALIAARSAGFNAARLLIGLNALLFAFIVIGFTRHQQGQTWRALLGVVFIVLLANQAFAVQSTPDYPGTGRLYLETDEVAAMEFASTHTDGPIYTDRLATFHRIRLLHPPSEAWRYDDSQFKAITTGYANRTLAATNHTYILQRSIAVYLFDVPGYWNLTWNPITTLERDRSKIYTTADTAVFYNSSSADG